MALVDEAERRLLFDDENGSGAGAGASTAESVRYIAGERQRLEAAIKQCVERCVALETACKTAQGDAHEWSAHATALEGQIRSVTDRCASAVLVVREKDSQIADLKLKMSLAQHQLHDGTTATAAAAATAAGSGTFAAAGTTDGTDADAQAVDDILFELRDNLSAPAAAAPASQRRPQPYSVSATQPRAASTGAGAAGASGSAMGRKLHRISDQFARLKSQSTAGSASASFHTASAPSSRFSSPLGRHL